MKNSASYPPRFALRRLFVSAISLITFTWLAINCYGAWYIARNTASYGLPDRGSQSEVFATDPQVAAAERSALAVLRPEDVRLRDAQLRAWYAPGNDKQPGCAVIIHGTGDSKVDPANGPELARITGGKLWAPREVGHCAAFDQLQNEFLERLDEVVAGAGKVESALRNQNRLL